MHGRRFVWSAVFLFALATIGIGLTVMGYQSQGLGLTIVIFGTIVGVPAFVGMAFQWLRTGSVDGPIVKSPADPQKLPRTSHSAEITALLAKVQNRNESLAKAMPELLALAQVLKNPSLEDFARKELAGYPSHKQDIANAPKYRQIPAYMSYAELNMAFVGFSNPANVLPFIRNNSDDFMPWNLSVPFPLVRIEQEAHKAVGGSAGWRFDFKAGQVLDKAMDPETPIYAYGDPAAWVNLLENVRAETTRRLLELLPALSVEAEKISKA